jgi:hypothetical protein
MTQHQQAILPSFSLAAFLPPYHEIRLPSSGFFDPAVPENIHVRGLTVKELKNLTATGRLDNKVFDSTLTSCIQEPINLQLLSMEDYNYIIYMIRLYSNGSKVSSLKSCDNNKCRKQFKFDYDISEVASITYASDMIEKTKTVELPRFLEEHNLHILVEVKRLTRKDIVEIERTLRIQTELAAKEGFGRKVYPLLEYLKTYIVSVTGFPVEVPKDQLLEIFSANDAERITNAFEGTSNFGVVGTAHPECPFCHEVNDYDIPFTDIFFL